MLIRSDFTTAGTLGGGCVENEVRKRAFGHVQQQQSALMEFLLDHDESHDDGLICGGHMTIAMQTIGAENVRPFREALLGAARRETVEIPLEVHHDHGLLRYRVRLEPAPVLVIAGAGHVGQAVARLAVDLDFRVVVMDDRADYACPDLFDPRVELMVGDIPRLLREFPLDAGSFVVIVTRGHKHDHTALDAVIRRDVAYLGLIGSRRKSRLIMSDLADDGVTAEQRDRVHTPIGLPIGAITVPEIAVSILAELVQVRRSKMSHCVIGPE
jgi:xanthine dehydrogenase accessory factor